MDSFSHLDAQGRPAMVDVSAKTPTLRRARAQSSVLVSAEVLGLLKDGELHSPKGAVFQTATIAGIMAAKQTGTLIPLCHPIGLDHCSIDIRIDAEGVILIECTATVTGPTGVEMEALVGASIAALTIYDMCKALGPDIIIRDTRLMEKTGGKKDFKRTR